MNLKCKSSYFYDRKFNLCVKKMKKNTEEGFLSLFLVLLKEQISKRIISVND